MIGGPGVHVFGRSKPHAAGLVKRDLHLQGGNDARDNFSVKIMHCTDSNFEPFGPDNAAVARFCKFDRYGDAAAERLERSRQDVTNPQYLANASQIVRRSGKAE